MIKTINDHSIFVLFTRDVPIIENKFYCLENIPYVTEINNYTIY